MNKDINTNHTFAICAYKESPYLEECIQSLMNQTVKSDILIATATPSKYMSIMGNMELHRIGILRILKLKQIM